MNLDYPEPTISIGEARKRFASLSLAHRQYIDEVRAHLRATSKEQSRAPMSKYLYRQLVQYGQRRIRQLELDL